MTTALAAVPRPSTPGAEMTALERFFPHEVTWRGTISAGGMGPGTPVMTADGRGAHSLVQDGRWVVGDYRQEQRLLDGTPVLTWQLHWVAGWDPARGTYRATVADCYGHAEVLDGRIDGDRLVFESTGDPPVRIRLTWELTGPAVMLWRNELRAGDGPWSLVEEYTCRTVPGVPAARRPAVVDAVRRFNRRRLNPVMLHLAGRRHCYAARLEHTGRRSGRAYATPVVARPVPGGFAVPLAYGRDVDWRHNLGATGRGVLVVDGVRYAVTSPRTVPAAEVTGALTPYRRRMLRGIPEYLVLTAEAAPAPGRAATAGGPAR